MRQSIEQAAPPTPRRPPRILYKVLNPTFKAILRSPFHARLSKRLLVMTFTGRKSGKRYAIPLGYVQQGNTVWIGTASRWSKNLRGGVPVSLRIQGHDYTGIAETITDQAGMMEGFGIMLNATPDLTQITGIRLDPDRQPNRNDIARAQQQGYVVIKVHLD